MIPALTFAAGRFRVDEGHLAGQIQEGKVNANTDVLVENITSVQLKVTEHQLVKNIILGVFVITFCK